MAQLARLCPGGGPHMHFSLLCVLVGIAKKGQEEFKYLDQPDVIQVQEPWNHPRLIN